jgi:hypothetical protein
MKHNVRKCKLDDAKDLTENKEPVNITSKQKGEAKVWRAQTKLYASCVKHAMKVTHHEARKRNYEALDSVKTRDQIIMKLLAITKRNIGLNVSLATKKTSACKSVEHRKSETKMNGIISHQKKPCLRHQGAKQQQIPSTCLNGDISKIPVAQTNGVCVEGKKSHQRKKSEHISVSLEEKCPERKTETVSHMLRSHGLCSASSDLLSGDDTEISTCRGKASSQNPSSVAAVRRTSTGSRKDQSKKCPPVAVRSVVSTLKKQVQQQQDLTVATLSRKVAPKKSLQSPKWSNGWKFEGDPFESKVFISVCNFIFFSIV